MDKRKRIFWANKSNARPLPEHIRQILAPYFPEYNLAEIQIFDGIPFYVTMDAVAFTDGNKLYFKPGCFDPNSIEGIALIGHEITHSVQFQQLGKWKFRVSYLGKWGRQFKISRSLNLAYYNNEFEVEAREVEQRIFDDLHKLQIERG